MKFPNTKNFWAVFCLIAVLILASILRLYQLTEVPPSLSWDEAAVGYNAYTIANWGKDEWGKSFPLVFTSFEDDKHPIHIYFIALAVKILGLNEFSTRLPAAIFGVLNVLVLYFIGKIVFKSHLIGLLAAFFLAISPYNLQFSRYAQESNFALFFFMLGILLFYYGISQKAVLLPFSFFSFGVSAFSYHSAKVVVPVIVLLLTVLYFRNLWQAKKYFLISIVIVLFLLGVILLNPKLLGTARIKQTSFPQEKVIQTNLYQKTHNLFLGQMELAYKQYLMHFSSEYLFEKGDKNPRHSTQFVGQFYKIDAILWAAGLILGILNIFRPRFSRKQMLILLFWILTAPIPASLVQEAPHASRALFMMGSFHLLAALGGYFLITIVKKPLLQFMSLVLIVSILGFLTKEYLLKYYSQYPQKYAIEWQYGMKQIVEYVNDHPEYERVFMTSARQQPYIFFLYYLQTPLPMYLENVSYNFGESRSYNLVLGYDKYIFGGWNTVESMPTKGILYVLTPYEYSGLRYKDQFDVKKLVYYPDGTEGYYLVSGF